MTVFYFIALAFCWGTAFLGSKVATAAVGPYWGAALRTLAGFIFFIILFIIKRKSVKIPANQLWRPWLLSSFLIVLPFLALFWGLQYAAPSISGIFNGTVPIWSFIAGAIILKGVDSFSWERAGGVLIGVAGLLIIMLPKVNFSGSMYEFYGCLAFTVMAILYAMGNVMTKYIMVDHKTISEEGNIFHQYLFAVIVLTAAALIFGNIPSLSVFTPKVTFSILYIGIISSAVAFLLLLQLIKRLGAMRAAAVTYITPLVAILVDIIFIKRMPTGLELLGVLLIFAGQFLIQKPLKNK